jgi:hypothetical protein
MATVHYALRDLTTGKIVAISGPVSADALPFRIADPNAQLWRYGDYWKFKGLFGENKLYFRRADRLSDALEGRFTEANKKQVSASCAAAFADLKLGDPTQIREIQEGLRVFRFLTCWHKNTHESRRMWGEYTKSTNALVITTKTPRLRAVFGERCAAFDVEYIDEDKTLPELHSLAALAFKRRLQFSHENEFRVVYTASDEMIYADREEDFGRTLPCNPGDFVDEIRFHPDATPEFKAEVRADLSGTSLSSKLRDSELTATN